MTVRFDLFAVGPAPPEDTWAIVGDPRNLPRWTDAERVTHLDDGPVREGFHFGVVADGRTLRWQVVTAESRLLEAVTDDVAGARVGIGVRVVREPPAATRLILAGSWDAVGTWRRLRGRVVDVPRLRRRLDAWAAAALAAAEQVS